MGPQSDGVALFSASHVVRPNDGEDWFITFGQAHVHKINGKEFNKNNALFVHGDLHYAKHVADCLFGKKYSFIRPIKEYIGEYWPDGLINLEGWSYPENFTANYRLLEICTRRHLSGEDGTLAIFDGEELVFSIQTLNLPDVTRSLLQQKVIKNPDNLSYLWNGGNFPPDIQLRLQKVGEEQTELHLTLTQRKND